MGPIPPSDKLPLLLTIPSGLSPERTIFLEGIVKVDASWFEISLQCGQSFEEKDDIAFRLRVECFDRYSTFKTDSFVSGRWLYDTLYPKSPEEKSAAAQEDISKDNAKDLKVRSKIELVEKEIMTIDSEKKSPNSGTGVLSTNVTALPSTSRSIPLAIHPEDEIDKDQLEERRDPEQPEKRRLGDQKEERRTDDDTDHKNDQVEIELRRFDNKEEERAMDFSDKRVDDKTNENKPLKQPVERIYDRAQEKAGLNLVEKRKIDDQIDRGTANQADRSAQGERRGHDQIQDKPEKKRGQDPSEDKRAREVPKTPDSKETQTSKLEESDSKRAEEKRKRKESLIQKLSFHKKPKAVQTSAKPSERTIESLIKKLSVPSLIKRLSFKRNKDTNVASTPSEEGDKLDKAADKAEDDDKETTNLDDAPNESKHETNDAKTDQTRPVRKPSFATEEERLIAVHTLVRRLSQGSSIEQVLKKDVVVQQSVSQIFDDFESEENDRRVFRTSLIEATDAERARRFSNLRKVIRSRSRAVLSPRPSKHASCKYLLALDPATKVLWKRKLIKTLAVMEDYLKKRKRHSKSQTMDTSDIVELPGEEEPLPADVSEFDILELRKGHEFRIALECLENGYLVAMNEELFCAYPHHVKYDRVKYICINGDVRLEELTVEGGAGRDRTLVMDLYDVIEWSRDVIILTDENFVDLVVNSLEMWFVEAYTGWCPACAQIQWQYERAACMLQGKVKVGASDCDRNEMLVDTLQVKYCPTIFYFKEGPKTFRSGRVYGGERLASCIVQFANHVLNGHVGLPEELEPIRPLARTLLKKRPPKLHPSKYKEVDVEVEIEDEDMQSLMHTGCCGETTKRHVGSGSYSVTYRHLPTSSCDNDDVAASSRGIEPKRCIIIDGFIPEDAVSFSIRLQCGPSIREKDDIAMCVTFNFDEKATSYSLNSFLAGVWEVSDENITKTQKPKEENAETLKDKHLTDIKIIEPTDQLEIPKGQSTIESKDLPNKLTSKPEDISSSKLNPELKELADTKPTSEIIDTSTNKATEFKEIAPVKSGYSSGSQATSELVEVLENRDPDSALGNSDELTCFRIDPDTGKLVSSCCNQPSQPISVDTGESSAESTYPTSSGPCSKCFENRLPCRYCKSKRNESGTPMACCSLSEIAGPCMICKSWDSKSPLLSTSGSTEEKNDSNSAAVEKDHIEFGKKGIKIQLKASTSKQVDDNDITEEFKDTRVNKEQKKTDASKTDSEIKHLKFKNANLILARKDTAQRLQDFEKDPLKMESQKDRSEVFLESIEATKDNEKSPENGSVNTSQGGIEPAVKETKHTKIQLKAPTFQQGTDKDSKETEESKALKDTNASRDTFETIPNNTKLSSEDTSIDNSKHESKAAEKFSEYGGPNTSKEASIKNPKSPKELTEKCAKIPLKLSPKDLHATKSSSLLKLSSKDRKNSKIVVFREIEDKDDAKDSEATGRKSKDLEFWQTHPNEVVDSNLIPRGADCRIIIECNDKGFTVTVEEQKVCDFDHRTDYDLITYLVLMGDLEVLDAGVMGAGGPTRWLIHATGTYEPWEQTYMTVLDDSIFEKHILESDTMWVVAFYMNKCEFHNELEEAASELRDQISFAIIDALVNLDTVKLLNVETVPTVLFYRNGAKKLTDFEVYDGEYTAKGIINWVLHKAVNKFGPPPGAGAANPYSTDVHMVGKYRRRVKQRREEKLEGSAAERDLLEDSPVNRERSERYRMTEEERQGLIIYQNEEDKSKSDSCLMGDRKFRTFIEVVVPPGERAEPMQFEYEDILGTKIPIIDYDLNEMSSDSELCKTKRLSKAQRKSKEESKSALKDFLSSHHILEHISKDFSGEEAVSSKRKESKRESDVTPHIVHRRGRRRRCCQLL